MALVLGQAAAPMRYAMERRGQAARAASRERLGPVRQRAIGSAGERLVHTEEVTGSIPVSPTQLSGRFRAKDRPFATHRAACSAWAMHLAVRR